MAATFPRRTYYERVRYPVSGNSIYRHARVEPWSTATYTGGCQSESRSKSFEVSSTARIRKITYILELTYRCSMYQDIVALSLFRTLNHDEHLPDGLGTPKLLCLRHCRRTLRTFQTYRQTWPLDEPSTMHLYPLFHVSAVLLNRPGNEDCSLFEDLCNLLVELMEDFPLARYILHACAKFIAALRVNVTSKTVAVLRELRPLDLRTPDVPVAFALPLTLHTWTTMLGGSARLRTEVEQQVFVELGELLAHVVSTR